MALVTRRYALRGPTNADLAKYVGTGTVSDTFPTETIEISIDNAIVGAITDLDAYMLTLGLEYAPADLPIRAFNANLAAPAFGVNLASQLRAGRSMLVERGPVGAGYAVQPAIFGNKSSLWSAQGNGTTVSLIGFGNSTTGTATSRNVGTTFPTQLRQIAYLSAAAAGNSSGTRHGLLQFWRGTAANLGGFFYCTRFVVDTVVAGMRWFVGLHGAATVIGNVDPSTLTNIAGFGIDSLQNTVRWFVNDGAGVATAVDLGVNFPAATANVVYEARIFCAPGGNSVFYSLERLDVANLAEGSSNADIPAAATLLSPQIWSNNAAVGGVVGLSVAQQYIETDF